MLQKFDPQAVSDAEVKRRLKLLGKLIQREYKYDQVAKRAKVVGLPVHILDNWLEKYRLKGEAGLREDFTGLSEAEIDYIWKRWVALGDVVDNEIITTKDIEKIAERNKCSFSTANRWAKRYRAAGPLGLRKHCNPLKKNKRANESASDPGAFTPEDVDEIFRKLKLLGPLATQEIVKDEDWEKRVNDLAAEGTIISVDSLKAYRRKLRTIGPGALRNKDRSDKGYFGKITDETIEIVQSIRLTHRNHTFKKIHAKAEEMAAELGLEPASYPQVIRICKDIPEDLLLIADGNLEKFYDKYGVTYPIRFRKKIVYQLDHTRVRVVVKDRRRKKYRNKNGRAVLWLITIIEANSGRILAWLFTYDRPNRFDIAEVIRRALLIGGVPHEIWTDFGPELIAKHVLDIADMFGFKIVPKGPNAPKLKGRIERPYRTFNDELFSTLKGYFGRSSARRRGRVRPKHTIVEMDQKLGNFINNTYHQRKHPRTKQTPLEYWRKKIITKKADPRWLDILMMEAFSRKVLKDGIHFKNRVYWHPDIGKIMNQRVIIRSPQRYFAPDTIEVFIGKKKHCFTAFANDSKQGLLIGQDVVGPTQTEQIQDRRLEIKAAGSHLDDLKAQIEEKRKLRGPKVESSEEVGKPAKPEKSGKKAPKVEKKAQKKSIFERMLEKEEKG